MRACLILTVLFSAGVCLAEQPKWDSVPRAYRVTADSVEASDGGRSTSDHYLLTREDYTDFALSFDITRLAAGGDKLRALVVWHVDNANRANREAVFLPAGSIPLGDTQRVEVVKLGAQCAVKLDGRTIATSAVVYGTPPARGRLGLLHYFNYHFRYTNWEFTPLDADHLPQPANLEAAVSESGVVELTWEMPDALEGLIEYEVVCRPGGDERERVVARGWEPRAVDRTARTGNSYTYAVAALSLGRTGPMSEEVRVTVDRSQPPKPVTNLRAVRRIDGSARLSWDLPADSRCAGLRVEADGEVLCERLSPDTRGWVAPAPLRDRYVLITLDPDERNHASAEASPERTAPAVRGDDAVPVRHPFLRYSAEDVDRVRRLAQSDEKV
ncbi:MAG: fibronectin type III domain-containing protein, partial [Armatimonadetes bacterium]|nr:fibronectin type III domain-containing protein [Armatimonadota bacterium]